MPEIRGLKSTKVSFPTSIASDPFFFGVMCCVSPMAPSTPTKVIVTAVFGESWTELGSLGLARIANPGTALTRELYTRVYDSIGKDLGDLYNRISTISRVERQPLAVTSKEVIATEADSIRQNFKGPNAMLADLSGPRREEFSGTYWWKAKLVDYNGELFADEATALGRAENI